jgi:LmbE family N-acetylglucosaminyl deacetylase
MEFGREKGVKMKETYLVVVAHPDDEVLGCGATLARLSKEGNKVITLILGEGATSRIGAKDLPRREKELKGLKEEAVKANRLLGVKKVFFEDLPDNRFDEVPLLDIIKKIAKIKDLIKPTIILTHHRNDLNIDHRMTYNAVLTAFRPIKGERAKEIYSFEVLSSTEWNYPNNFTPNFYLNAAQNFDKKIKAMKAYKREIRKWPHPRSVKAIKALAQKRGSEVGLEFAEAFEMIRRVKL